MCGFIGRIAPGQKPEDLRRGLPWIARRGPDSQRLWSSADGQVSLLFCRLAIVDKDPRADQPLTNRDSGVTVAMVGEIYNYLELKPRFAHYAFHSQSDTELILAAYLTLGAQGFHLLKGMFAFALVDERRRRIFLCRDAVGKKPLMLARWNGEVLFGSSLIPLVASHGKRVEIDPDAARHYWEESFVPAGGSVFKGASPVLPGQLLELDWNGGVASDNRCEPEPARIYRGETPEEAERNVGELIEAAVRRRLANNPSPIALLSGGIDSTLVADSAARLCAGDPSRPALQALTLAPLVPGTQDMRYAGYAARRIGVPLEILNPAFGSMRESVLQSLDLQDEPLGMPSFFLLERLTRAAARHGRVLLSGEGGDEIFLGYGRPSDWKRAGGRMQESPRVVTSGPRPPEWMSSWARRVVTDTLVGHMFAKADRASAEQGVELRCPLLDWDVVAYARSLPFEILTRGGRPKAALKEQLKQWPRWFVDRRKGGFAYNLRWLWALSGYAGLREHIDARALETFDAWIPARFRKSPRGWSSLDIFRHFGEAWRLLAWSRFLARFDQAATAGQPLPIDRSRHRICIVTSAPVSQNPRVVKEADALSEAGYEVTVLYGWDSVWTGPLDRDLVGAAKWKADSVSVAPVNPLRWLFGRALALRLKLFRLLARVLAFRPVPETAYARYYWEQSWLASRRKADLYIGHNPQSLPIVAAAACRAGSRYAFDFEDLHCRDLPRARLNDYENRLLAGLMERYLPSASYLSASSEGIGREVARLYGVRTPVTARNAFCWADRNRLDGMVKDRAPEPKGVSFYWYSQIVGLDRGLQDVIRALGRVDSRAELHIRGKAEEATRSELSRLAAQSGAEGRVHFHATVPPGELLSRCAEHDVGLSLEQPMTFNRCLCIPNKLLFYLLAGLPVIATRLPGSQEVSKQAGGALFLYEPGDVESLAGLMNRLTAHGELLRQAKVAALEAARLRWNWEMERRELIAKIDQVMLGWS